MWGRYLVATLAVAIVVAVRVVARPVLHTDIPWISFSPAVLVAAWYGGVGPGLAAILLSVVASDYFLLEPHGALGLRTASQVSGAGVFVLSGALMTALIERARKAMVERERVLAATRGQRDLLQSIIAGAPAAIALLEGPNHRFIVANPGYYALARGKGAMIGRTVEEVWPEIAETVGILLDRVFYSS